MLYKISEPILDISRKNTNKCLTYKCRNIAFITLLMLQETFHSSILGSQFVDSYSPVPSF